MNETLTRQWHSVEGRVRSLRVEATGNGSLTGTEAEVLAKAEGRRFMVEYKLKILQEADRCMQPGQIGSLLRREGMCWSNLTNWRKQRERGELAGLSREKTRMVWRRFKRLDGQGFMPSP